MTHSVKNTLSITLRVSLLALVLVGPLGAMALSQERGFGEESGAIGFVLIKSLQRRA